MGWGGGLEGVPPAKRVGKDPNLAPLHRLGLVSRLGAATGGVASCPAEPSLRPSGYWASGSRPGAVPPPLPSKPPPEPNRASPAPEPAAPFAPPLLHPLLRGLGSRKPPGARERNG